jgi:hypothetical protein
MESRMKCINSTKLRMKSGVWGTHHLLGGKAHSRSLGFARDDKFEVAARLSIGGVGWRERRL